MSDNVQLIKNEIERLKNHTLNIQKSTNGLITSVGRGRIEAFNDILKFIDSLLEEPTSEDLEEEITKCYKSRTDLMMTRSQFGELIHHFAKWQKQQDEELFRDDSWNYIEENYPNISQEEKLRLYDISIKSRLAGANAIKQKMIKLKL